MLKDVKIALVKGETGRAPNTEEIQKAIAENPSILVDETMFANAVGDWLTAHKDELVYDTVLTELAGKAVIYTAEKSTSDNVNAGEEEMIRFEQSDFGIDDEDFKFRNYIVVGLMSKCASGNWKTSMTYYQNSVKDTSKVSYVSDAVLGAIVMNDSDTARVMTARVAIMKMR